MDSNNPSSAIAKFLALGTPLVSIFLLIGVGTDPVNVTKLFALGGLGIGVFGILLLLVFKRENHLSRFVLVVSIFFILAMLNSVAQSPSPFLQNFFGVYGRNNGFATYLLLLILFMAATIQLPRHSYEKMIYGFFFAGIVNIAYCAWVLLFGDFVGWYNPYKKILGLLGNPDFISAFLGMVIVGLVSYSLKPELSIRIRIFLYSLSAVALIEIVSSHAIQGLAVTAIGLVIVGFFLLRSLTESRFMTMSYVVAFSVLGFFSVLGALQKGPLDFIYKRSVSLRGSYWHAGLEMGLQNPFSGVGMDSYGDWYRRTRPPQALVDLPGVNTMSNVAHNVLIDFFAFGGFPLLISYLALITFTLISILKHMRTTRQYDPVFVSLTTVWIAYQAQSFISINQIGLAIWGWVFGGAIISYTKVSLRSAELTPSTRKRQNNAQVAYFSPMLAGGIGAVIGCLIFSGPLAQDTRWFSATKSKEVIQVEKALESGFLNPVSSTRYLEAVDLFYRSGLRDKALEYSRKAVRYNPEYFDLWRQMYGLDNTPPKERSVALQKMMLLDPLNPDVTQK
jgi:O-antigen ligase